MKIKTLFTSTAVIFSLATSAAPAAPHWTHEEQQEWGAISDDSQTIAPLMYPYAA